MLKFERSTLGNGLRILVNEDRSTPLAGMAIVYNVGSKNEDPQQTGLAHLFEHLMFGGSVNIPEYDRPLQVAGGENNAFTNNDITCYYLSMPSENIETGFWLESDRMLGLDFNQGSLDIQKRVVAEEFKQRYLNQPYGDIMLLLRPLAYLEHPYLWPTIGKDISHIDNVTIETVKEFYYSFYAPDNAVVCIAGNIDATDALMLSEKWFGQIEKRNVAKKILPAETEQKEERRLTVKRNVPSDMLYKAWHICERLGNDFNTLDLLTDILSGGESGRLYTSLVRDRQIFTEVNAYLTGDADPGLLIIYGKPSDDVDLAKADEAILSVIDDIKNNSADEAELEKVRNKFESSFVLANTNVLSKAMNLAFYETLGDADIVNREVEQYSRVTQQDLVDSVNSYLRPENCCTLFYKSERRK